jgi:lipid-A-disaccharide synthase
MPQARSVDDGRSADGDAPIVLMTAFEPSGDAHAAPVARALREMAPGLRVVAFGGPRMREAGAELLGQTTSKAAMGLSARSKIALVRRTREQLRAWLADNEAQAHVAVDSPAANFPICKTTRRAGLRIAHLVGPQLWAWGGWRLGKLRRLTDLVLCLLPFEEAWFAERGVPARFIGHPRLNRDIDAAAIEAKANTLPVGSPKLALLPGSRPQEVRANLDDLLDVFEAVQRVRGETRGLIAAADDETAELIREQAAERLNNAALTLSDAGIDAVVHWADFCLCVSGTVTLDVTRHETPMIGLYRVTRFAERVSRVLLRTPHRLLPNVIAGEEVVPEFVPFAGPVDPARNAALALIGDPEAMERQRTALRAIRRRYEGKRPDEEAAKAILELLKRP